MRRLPRHLIALTTVGLLTWFGLSLLGVHTVIGVALLSAAALRLTLWIVELIRRLRTAD